MRILRMEPLGRDGSHHLEAIQGVLMAAGFCSISSNRLRARGLSLSDLIARAASPRVASFRTVEFAEERLRSDLMIACSKARAASSLFQRASKPDRKDIRIPDSGNPRDFVCPEWPDLYSSRWQSSYPVLYRSRDEIAQISVKDPPLQPEKVRLARLLHCFAEKIATRGNAGRHRKPLPLPP